MCSRVETQLRSISFQRSRPSSKQYPWNSPVVEQCEPLHDTYLFELCRMFHCPRFTMTNGVATLFDVGQDSHIWEGVNNWKRPRKVFWHSAWALLGVRSILAVHEHYRHGSTLLGYNVFCILRQSFRRRRCTPSMSVQHCFQLTTRFRVLPRGSICARGHSCAVKVRLCWTFFHVLLKVPMAQSRKSGSTDRPQFNEVTLVSWVMLPSTANCLHCSVAMHGIMSAWNRCFRPESSITPKRTQHDTTCSSSVLECVPRQNMPVSVLRERKSRRWVQEWTKLWTANRSEWCHESLQQMHGWQKNGETWVTSWHRRRTQKEDRHEPGRLARTVAVHGILNRRFSRVCGSRAGGLRGKWSTYCGELCEIGSRCRREGTR